MDISHIKTQVNIMEMLGRPYRIGGRGPANYDCWGLCRAVAHAIGRPLPELDVAGGREERTALVEENRSHFRRLGQSTVGCLVLFRIIDERGLVSWHIGTVLPDRRHFIHITEKTGVALGRLDRQPWKLFLEGFYQYQR